MKREGRQHGVVRSYQILPPDPLSSQKTRRRHVKTVDSALVKGMFTKVSRKPTNQSKFTGKCGKAQCLGCHIHPATKSKDKTKGTMKMRSSIGGSDHGLVVGTSATDVVAHLTSLLPSYDDGATECYDHDVNIPPVAAGLAASEDTEDEDEYLSYCDVGLMCRGTGDDADLFVDDGWCFVGYSQ